MAELLEQARRACIFCGATGSLTREHVIPQWVMRLMKDLGFDDSVPFRFESGGLAETDRQGAMSQMMVVKSVCTGCNSGWMADLEGRVNAVLRGMILGEETPLDARTQVDLATWASKTVLAIEYLQRDTVVAWQADRDMVRSQDRPPSHHRVRLAYRDTYSQPLGYTMFVAGSKVSAADEVDVFTLTLAMGSLIVQVWGGSGAPLRPGVQWMGNRNGQAVLIWPPVHGGTEWPPVNSIDEDRFEEFAAAPLPKHVITPKLSDWRQRRAHDAAEDHDP